MADSLSESVRVMLRSDGVAIVTDPMRPSGDRMKTAARQKGLLVDVEEDLIEDEGKVHVVRQFTLRIDPASVSLPSKG
jgi:hypothetical protein